MHPHSFEFEIVHDITCNEIRYLMLIFSTEKMINIAYKFILLVQVFSDLFYTVSIHFPLSRIFYLNECGVQFISQTLIPCLYNGLGNSRFNVFLYKYPDYALQQLAPTQTLVSTFGFSLSFFINNSQLFCCNKDQVNVFNFEIF